MKLSYVVTLSCLLLCAPSLTELGVGVTDAIDQTADTRHSTPSVAGRSQGAQGAIARTAKQVARAATMPLQWSGKRVVRAAAQIGSAIVLPAVVRRPELSRLPGLRWSATAANTLDLPSDVGPIAAYRKMRPYASQLATETPMWRAYYVSVRWLRRHLGIDQWEPPSRAPRFEELDYLRNRANVEPRNGRYAGLHWNSAAPEGTPLAKVEGVLGEGFANRVFRGQLHGEPIAVKARKSKMDPWLRFRTRDQRLPHELDGAVNLHKYADGPSAQLVKFEQDGQIRLGIGLDVVEGQALSGIISGDAADFTVTRGHVDSINQLFAHLDAQGLWLEDLHDGQLILRADGSVTPIDMRVEPMGNGNPMVLEYARRRAGILDEVSRLANASQ